MDLLNQNIAALKQYKPKFYESLQERLSEYIPGVESSGVLIDIARDGSPYMQYQFQDAMVRLNSNYNPSREADQWAGQYTFSQYNSTAILFGIGSGYFAEALLNRMQKTDHLILLEPKEEVFFECLHKIDLTKLIRDERTMFALGSPDTGNIFHLMVVFVHWANLSSMQVMKHPNYEKLFVNDNLLFDNEIRSEERRVGKEC